MVILSGAKNLDQTLQKYLSDITLEQKLREELKKIVYEDEHQIVKGL